MYNSKKSLEYVRLSILRTLEANLRDEDRSTLNSLPLVIMLAYEPYMANELRSLREDGKLLARS